MTSKDKLYILALGLLISACLIGGMCVILDRSTPDYMRGVAALNPLTTVGPIAILGFVGCGTWFAYLIWAMTPRGREHRARYLREHESEIRKGNEILTDHAIGCAILGPCFIPILVILLAAFVFAILFLGGLVSR